MKRIFVSLLGRLVSKLNRLYIRLTTGVVSRIDLLSPQSMPSVYNPGLVNSDINSPQAENWIIKGCRFEARMIAARAIVEGEFKGRLISGEAIIKGKFESQDSICPKLEIFTGSVVTGSITYDPRYLVIHPGAYIFADLKPMKNIDLGKFGIIVEQPMTQPPAVQPISVPEPSSVQSISEPEPSSAQPISAPEPSSAQPTSTPEPQVVVFTDPELQEAFQEGASEFEASREEDMERFGPFPPREHTEGPEERPKDQEDPS